jgi:hypothetical protein
VAVVAVSPDAVSAVAEAAAVAATSVVAAAAVSVEKAAPAPARRPHATRAKLKTLEHRPQLQKPEQLDRPSIPTEATSATNFPRLAMQHSLAPPMVMWSAAAGQTMPPTLGRSYEARVVFLVWWCCR